MTTQLKVSPLAEDVWDVKASMFSDYNLYQTWAYQKARVSRRKHPLIGVEIADDQGPCLLALARIIKVPLIGLRIGYIQWGPLLRRNGDAAKITSEAIGLLREYYLPRYVDVLRITPNIYTTEVGDDFKGILASAGFEQAPQIKPYHTILFPLDIEEEHMRQKFQNKWRASLRKAEKNGMAADETQDVQTLYEFEKIYQHSQKRKQFKGLNIREFIQTQECLPAGKKLNLVVIKKDNQLLSVDINSYLGDTSLGLFQSTTEPGLSLGASYLAWWHTFLAAKRAGMRRYDMGGIDPVGNPNVYQFKLRMGGDEALHLGCFDAYKSSWTKKLCFLLDQVHLKIKGK